MSREPGKISRRREAAQHPQRSKGPGQEGTGLSKRGFSAGPSESSTGEGGAETRPGRGTEVTAKRGNSADFGEVWEARNQGCCWKVLEHRDDFLELGQTCASGEEALAHGGRPPSVCFYRSLHRQAQAVWLVPLSGEGEKRVKTRQSYKHPRMQPGASGDSRLQNGRRSTATVSGKDKRVRATRM